jgi:hypothetical protein
MSVLFCEVCGDDAVLTCGENHGICSDCFQGQTTEWLSYRGRIHQFVALEGIKCVAIGCNQVYASTSVETHCSCDVFKQYITASLIWRSKKTTRSGVPESKECTGAKDAVQAAVDLLREQCLNIFCPWCKSVYVIGPDFDECFAMKCMTPGCECDFCGYCGEGFAKRTPADYGIDACHRHVLREPPCSPLNTGLTPRDKDQAVRHLAAARITTFLESLTEVVKVAVIFCVAQDLTSLGLSADMFLGEQYVWIHDDDVELL